MDSVKELGHNKRVWWREFLLLSLEMTQTGFANRNHQANTETCGRRTVHSSVFQHPLSQGNENELFILVRTRGTKNYGQSPLSCLNRGITIASELPNANHCKHATVYLEKCIFPYTYHERSDYHIWHLRQLVVQQSSGRMICHLYRMKGEYTLIHSILQTKQC